jgi:membrane protein
MASNPPQPNRGAGSRLRALLHAEHWPDRLWVRMRNGREILQFAMRRAGDVRLAQVAGGLTFTTVLSVVPLLAVALSLFAAFPLFAEYRVALEKNLLSGMLPEQYAPMLMRHLNNFTAKAGGLTAMGLAFLLFTALSMVLTVDRIFNDIWRVTERRRLVQRVLLYWCLLTLGPLVIGASLSAASWVLSASAGWTRKLPAELLAVLELTPFFLGASALVAAYAVIPNRKVLWRDAILGALVASVLGEAMRAGFGWYIRAGTVASIYGAFAVFPLFLLWIYLSWLTVLFGAAVAATAPLLRSTRFADETRAGNQFITAVALVRALLAAHRLAGGDRGVPLAELTRAARCAPDDAERMLQQLEQLGYAARLDGPHRGSWTLICDPRCTSLAALFKRLAVDPDNSLVRDGAALGNWVASGLRADWIARPLDETL